MLSSSFETDNLNQQLQSIFIMLTSQNTAAEGNILNENADNKWNISDRVIIGDITSATGEEFQTAIKIVSRKMKFFIVENVELS